MAMSFLSFLLGEKKKTASVAKERLQIILAHERSGRNAAEPDYLPALQRDLVAVRKEPLADREADAARAAGDDGDAPGGGGVCHGSPAVVEISCRRRRAATLRA